MIPLKSAMVLWNCEPRQGAPAGERSIITELAVVDIDNQPWNAHRLLRSRGACSDDWLYGSRHTDPRGLFLELIALNTFHSVRAKIDAIREFAKIEGQADWTSYLLRELGEPADE